MRRLQVKTLQPTFSHGRKKPPHIPLNPKQTSSFKKTVREVKTENPIVFKCNRLSTVCEPVLARFYPGRFLSWEEEESEDTGCVLDRCCGCCCCCRCCSRALNNEVICLFCDSIMVASVVNKRTCLSDCSFLSFLSFDSSVSVLS